MIALHVARLDTMRRVKLSVFDDIIRKKVEQLVGDNLKDYVKLEEFREQERKLQHIQSAPTSHMDRTVLSMHETMKLLTKGDSERRLKNKQTDLASLVLSLEDVVGEPHHTATQTLRDEKGNLRSLTSAVETVFEILGGSRVVSSTKERGLLSKLSLQQESISKLQQSVEDLRRNSSRSSDEGRLMSTVTSLERKVAELQARLDTSKPGPSFAELVARTEALELKLNKIQNSLDQMPSNNSKLNEALSKIAKEQTDLKTDVTEMKARGQSFRDSIESRVVETTTTAGAEMKQEIDNVHSKLHKVEALTQSVLKHVDESYAKVSGLVQVPHDEDNWKSLEEYNVHVMTAVLRNLDRSFEEHTRKCNEQIETALNSFQSLRQKRRRGLEDSNSATAPDETRPRKDGTTTDVTHDGTMENGRASKRARIDGAVQPTVGAAAAASTPVSGLRDIYGPQNYRRPLNSSNRPSSTSEPNGFNMAANNQSPSGSLNGSVSHAQRPDERGGNIGEAPPRTPPNGVGGDSGT
ncbi:hypothetical protein M427DRAFT_243778 [Gonapodya prolifera JEL478]|uniref:Uncharacterized protein n=1 Tax=Gonapodya prolifera (strain JEL478) TaxID=1344416 RepID=A0A139AMC9_GONPJ|nr:hypothetical protein M427DRAFT_243778 [Gonapodya prolifera JEL478]|eukprot:KXS17683.1 hypothetical protein M427DRAFT_243778 [Gonapodya prolifera JEL478]